MGSRRTHAPLSEFGKRVEAWRKKHGLSQAVVADLIGTHQRTLSDWMREDCMPGAVLQIARLASLMGETVGDLVEGDVSVAPLATRDVVSSLVARAISPAAARRYVEEFASRERKAEEGSGA